MGRGGVDFSFGLFERKSFNPPLFFRLLVSFLQPWKFFLFFNLDRGSRQFSFLLNNIRPEMLGGQEG